jgi:hypothetical protein
MQTELFDLPATTTKTDCLRKARELRDDGISRAINHANHIDPTLGERALSYVQQIARSSGQRTVTSEYIRQYAEQNGLPFPPDKRAWGAVMRRAAKAGYIRKVGWTTATDPKVHCNPVSLWEVV